MVIRDHNDILAFVHGGLLGPLGHLRKLLSAFFRASLLDPTGDRLSCSCHLYSNLAFGDWGQVFQGERMTAALLDRLTHRCHIFEMNGQSYRFRESVKAGKKTKATGEGKAADPKAAVTLKV